MHMDHVALDCFNRRHGILLFDVGMKRVIQRFNGGVINFIKIIGQLFHRVQKVYFKTIDSF